MRLAALLLIPMGLGGCALPLEYNLASHAIDGLSYLFSGKSATDHALSSVAARDCAMLRAMDGDDICLDYAMPDSEDGESLAWLDGAPVHVAVTPLPPLAEGVPVHAATVPVHKPRAPMLALDAARPLPKPVAPRLADDPAFLARAAPQPKPATPLFWNQLAALAR
ncbi:MAG: hypothetical protein EXQ97_02220 [Alphaproteobacteria bacterium]|nr:hypothetical protein [Alphaproteobacteria bacterium]